uniref:Endonuclease/exonuclease/phosphatase domain-containing protein n=1 Tax=Plectus sambesii TaxID=2011161 RepID=A0A914W5D0_9BILA
MVSSNLYIGSYQAHAKSPHTEAKKIKYGIISLAEVKKCGTGCIDLKNGASLYYLGHADKAKDGVGFFVNLLQKQQVHGFITTSPRITQLLLQIRNSDQLLRLIQVYAPATSAKDPSDATYNAFLDDLASTLTTRIDRRVEQTIILGDLNAKVGLRLPSERVVSSFGYGSRNDRGEKLVDFCAQHALHIANTFFKKRPQRKWTWEMANGAAYNEIDFILISNMRTVAYTSVLNHFNAGSDHRLVRASIRTGRPLPRPTAARRPMRVTFNRAIYNFALQTQLAADPCNETDADSLYAKLVDNVNAATTIATFQEPQPTPLSDEKLAPLRQRREWKREAGRTSRAGRTRIEYVELCQTIHKTVKEDLHMHHIPIIKQAVQDGRLRHTRSKMAHGR